MASELSQSQAHPADALHAIARLMSAALDTRRPAHVQRTLVVEARAVFDAGLAVLLKLDPSAGFAHVGASVPEGEATAARVALQSAPSLMRLADDPHGHVCLTGRNASDLARAVGWRTTRPTLVLLPVRSCDDSLEHVLLLGLATEPSRAELETAEAFASAAASALTQLRNGAEQDRRNVEQAALARAAKALSARGLELQGVLATICREARAIFDADSAGIYRGGAHGLRIEAVDGLEDDAVGARIGPNEGLAGQVVVADRAMFTNAYAAQTVPVPGGVFAEIKSALAAPIRWDGELRGVLSVGFHRPRAITRDDLALLEGFAELAAVACRNANAAAGLALAARTDGLTGCLNRGGLEEALASEVGRAARTDRSLSLILIDLDEFKQVNERAGHLIGDEVLRRVGHALHSATRPYDIVARYGGDEFVVLAPDVDEIGAIDLAGRVVERVHHALLDLKDVDGTVATAGVAEWAEGVDGHRLLEDADRALLYGKQELGRGGVVGASDVPFDFGPERRAVKPSHAPQQPAGIEWTPVDAAQLRRRTHQLAMANALGSRLAAMTDASSICEAVAEELNRAFGFFLCEIVALREDSWVESVATRGEAFQRIPADAWAQPSTVGIIGRCLRERRRVLVVDVEDDPDYKRTKRTFGVRSELAAPLWVGGELWGAINLEELVPGAFDQEDARLLEIVADMTGSALRGALLYEQLERAYLGTAEALANALEAKDAYTASHARSIVDWADAVGRRLGLDESELRDVRYGAALHDIGKIALPEAILHKPGPLTAEERAEVERHTVVGEQILSPISFLGGVLPIVRHEHERWDGGGYPDGLEGDEIPIGARIVFACDAYHAMTSDRPYRRAMTAREARAELIAGAATQFDPLVVEALLSVLDGASSPRSAPVRA